jgi:hypothetical protein
MKNSFHWKQISKGLFRQAAIEIYSDSMLIGTIPDKTLKREAQINGKRFSIKKKKGFWFPKAYLLLDPDTKNLWCEIEEYEDGKIWATISKKRYDIGIREDDNPSQSNGLIIQGYNDKLFSCKNGRLEIRTELHPEILIVYYFFVRHLSISIL